MAFHQLGEREGERGGGCTGIEILNGGESCFRNVLESVDISYRFGQKRSVQLY